MKYYLIHISFSLLFILWDSSYGNTLSGIVKYDGKPMPKIAKTQLKMNADPICGSSHKTPVYMQSLIVNDNATLKNTVVYLKNVEYKGEIPKTPAVLDQKGCMYIPHVQAIQAGQELLIKNSDATLHNIHGKPKINAGFNFAMPKVVKEKTIVIEKAENAMYIKCDVHPWMKAYVSVFDHPYFSVTDDKGSYKIDNIPPGTYEVVAWHERDAKYEGYEQIQTIKIEGEKTNLDFALTKGKKRKKK
tara:strand:+ start:101 stop:835 length:735 start_codon:yes stop_codon:yes gene_type:complete